MLSSTWEFLEKLKLFIFKPSDCMLSFDVVSLFTNVPLIETIDIISDYVYKSKSKPAFSKLVFKELLNIATSGSFMYNGRLYRQVDGVTMGRPWDLQSLIFVLHIWKMNYCRFANLNQNYT